MIYSVFGGFDASDRNVHFHLHPKTRYASVRMLLNLAEYVDKGYPLTQLPMFYYHEDDPRDHDICKLRGFGSPIKCRSQGRGHWTWQLDCVTQGIIDVVWDLDGPETRLREQEPETQSREKLVRSKLTACQVFEIVMRFYAEAPRPSFRAVERNAHSLLPKSGYGSDLPLKETTISRLIPALETMLAETVFFGSPVLLFHKEKGKGSVPTEQARIALRMLAPHLAKIASENSGGRPAPRRRSS